MMNTVLLGPDKALHPERDYDRLIAETAQTLCGVARFTYRGDGLAGECRRLDLVGDQNIRHRCDATRQLLSRRGVQHRCQAC